MRRRAAAFLAGPLALIRNAPVKAGILLALVFLLTAMTQIGGLVLWLCVPAFSWAGERFAGRSRVFAALVGFGIFALAYLVASLAIMPVAALSGRAPLPCGWGGETELAPRTRLTCLANRHYMVPPAKQALQTINKRIVAENRDFQIVYLDAGFPFFDRFPLIPHLSHGDGRKVDLALVHQNGKTSASPIGYWSYVQPRPGDPKPCEGREGWLRWNFEWLQPEIGDSPLDEEKTRSLLLILSSAPEVRRILIEPHLKHRLGLDHPKIRFQGCRAARHDDHIHVEF